MSVNGVPQAELLFEIVAECTPPEDMGTIDGGKARMIPIVGGTVSGPRLNGTVMPGADWSIMREGGVATVEARYALRADDGTIIQIWNAATTRVGQPGEDGVMMITTPRFIAPEGPHAWLNHGVYVGTLIPDMSGGSFAVKIGVFGMT
jgi:hypothetical protein